MRMFRIARRLSIFAKRESGLTFIETLLALVILSAVGAAFLGGLATTSRAVMVSGERVVAEDLAKSQLEYIRIQEYISAADYDPTAPAKRYQLIDISDELLEEGYSIDDIDTPQVVITSGWWFELQKVTVVVKRNNEELLTTSDYKMSGES